MATFTTTKEDGTQVEISLTKIGYDKATITVKEWSKNNDPMKDKANKKEEHKLKNIKSDKDGSKITAKNDGFFYADIEITVNGLESPKDQKEKKNKPTITIKVSNTFRGKGDGTTAFVISEKERGTILKFLKDSKFPASEGVA